ncbi:MAG TPA: diguanylate cyclase, partial [Nevskiaceae bacterium]|nr:diguanylate cyclase [Nevskiaceae bacterium]
MPSANVIHLQQPTADPLMAAAGQKKKLRALLVEDSMADARLLRELVRDADPTLQPELTHVQTLAHATAAITGGNYDCVLLDLNLPDGSGVETVEAVRGASREIAIIVLSGLNEEGLALQALRRGAQEYALKGQYDGDALLRIMHHAVERNRVFADVDRQREREYFLATHDPLTGLPNRQMLLDHARLAITQAERHKGGLALCFVDLDNFKPVNDTHGHAIGDALLCEVGSILSQSVRDGDTVARTGGDEFIVLLTSVSSAEEAQAVSQRMADRISSIRELKGCAINIGASIGLAVYPEMGKSFEELMANADVAMYEVKRGRGGGVGRARGAVPAVRTERAAQDAVLYFQPWWDASRRSYGGVEVLPRAAGRQGEPFKFADSSAAPLTAGRL